MSFAPVLALESWVMGVVVESASEKNSALAITARVMQLAPVIALSAMHLGTPLIISVALCSLTVLSNGRCAAIVDLAFNKIAGGMIFSATVEKIFALALAEFGRFGAMCTVAAPAAFIGSLALASLLVWNFPASQESQKSNANNGVETAAGAPFVPASEEQ